MRRLKKNSLVWEQTYGEKKPEMFYRALIPVFLSFSGGILVGHELLYPFLWLMPCVFICTTFSLIATLFLPRQFKLYFLLGTFFLTGIFLVTAKQDMSRLQPFAKERARVIIQGTVLEPAKFNKETARLTVRADNLFIGDRNIPVNENLMATVYKNPTHIMPGERIRFPARLRPFKNFNNPGRYDYKSAMKLKGLTCTASVSDGRYIVLMGKGDLPFPYGLIEKGQRPVRDFFRKTLDPQDDALYRALILGERQGIDSMLRDPFNKTGLGHVLAVSGLHIGLVACIAFFVIRWLLSRSYLLLLKTDIRRLTALMTCLPVIGYTCLAGFQISSQRAMIMALAFLWSIILGREKETWSTLSLAGLFILAIDPYALFSISFQLSFAAVIGILWLMPALLEKLPLPPRTSHRGKRIPERMFSYVVGLIAVTFSATIFLLPLTSFYFHRISLITIPANLTVVPVLGLWVIPFGLLSAVVLPLSTGAAELLLHMGTWGLHGMIEIIRFWADFSWSSSWVVTPNLLEITMFYLLVFLIFFFRRWSWAKKGVLILVFFVLVDVGYWIHRVQFNRHLSVTFLDVGQGNAALVEFPFGEKMLIDGGGFPRSDFDVGKMVVAPYLWHSKIADIDYLVLSHPHSDHMNGLRFIASNFHPKEFWYNGNKVKTCSFMELMAIIDSKGIKKRLPGDLMNGRQMNGVKVEVLHPYPGKKHKVFDNRSSLNNNSLVLKISYGGKSFLFTGDIEEPAEEVLVLNAGHALKSDVLLSPHHGSKSSSSKDFLLNVRPDVCVISSGKGNSFGFPHQQTLERLQDLDCRIIRIDQTGAAQFVFVNNQFEITTFLKDSGPGGGDRRELDSLTP